ncbi:DMT family transporter [Thauera sp. 2A1]|uniref:DMT family transporter n=1 Tax=Thauera sp. 2A1 TaxID=2570191 RepID=UPI001292A534|nr:DMT family transporter [Thauera sp. 2A1]KAI5913420.1 DMT family transporter [Thauera sp. 2A1]
MNQRVLGALLVAVSAVSFGAMAIFARYAYADGADVVAVLFLRFAIAAILMSIYMALARRHWPRGRSLAILAAMGGVGYVGQSLAFFSALNHATAGLVALLLYLYPFLVTVLGAVFLREPLGVGRVLAVLAALVGTALTLGGGIAGEPVGVALGVAAALIYSIYILVGSRVLARSDAMGAATVVMISAAVVFGAITLATRPRFPVEPAGWAAVLAIAVVSTVIAMGGFFAGIRLLGAADAATLSTLEPAVTIALAAIFLDEPLNRLQLVGGAIILAAVVWLTRAGARNEDEKPDGCAAAADTRAGGGAGSRA